MLRIDETSGTLVAPEATLGPDVDLDRDELLRLLVGGWSAFAAEIGQPGLQLAVTAPVPGVDVLAVDETGSRMTVVSVATGLDAALHGAATVASWDGEHLAAVHPMLAGAVPGDSPRLLLVAASFDDSMLTTVDWLARRHAVEAAAYRVQVLRFVEACERCAIPNRDPDTQEKWPELLRHVTAEHQQLFGIYARVVIAGRLAVGQAVEIT